MDVLGKHLKYYNHCYRESGLHILSAIDDIQTLLDDHLIKSLSMKGSAFVKPIEGWSIIYQRNKHIELLLNISSSRFYPQFFFFISVLVKNVLLKHKQ